VRLRWVAATTPLLQATDLHPLSGPGPALLTSSFPSRGYRLRRRRRHGSRIRTRHSEAGLASSGFPLTPVRSTGRCEVTNHDFADVRLQQVVRPSRPRSLLQRDAHISTQPADEPQKHAPLGLVDAFHHNFSSRIHHCDRNTFVYSNRYKGCSFLERLSQALQAHSKRGALL
jgi:hypothetical protein